MLFDTAGEPTNDSKDPKDIWGKNDEQVDKGEQNEGDGDVTGPIEGLVGEHHLLDCSSHLSTVFRDIFNHGTGFLRQPVQKVKPLKAKLTGKSTMGTVSVTAVSTATRTHRISVSYGSMRL